jgi:outer membrane biosynthesis protein TonB
MKLPAKNVAWLLPLLLSGCIHKTDQAQVQPLAPPIVDAPPAQPAPPTDLPPPVVTPPQSSTPAPTAKPAQEAPEEPQPKPRKPAAPKPTQQASNENTGVSAIGELSTGDPSDLKQRTEATISATERGLKDIGRQLNDQELKTAAQIREFLKEARTALTSGDVDGAHTLAAKARILLSELTK